MLIENSRGSEWRKYDLHMHSTASDGRATARELVNEAVNKGIAVIALTDIIQWTLWMRRKHMGKKRGLRLYRV